MRIPESVDDLTAACLPEAFLTVWYNVIVRASLKAGETLLVHGESAASATLPYSKGDEL